MKAVIFFSCAMAHLVLNQRKRKQGYGMYARWRDISGLQAK